MSERIVRKIDENIAEDVATGALYWIDSGTEVRRLTPEEDAEAHRRTEEKRD